MQRQGGVWQVGQLIRGEGGGSWCEADKETVRTGRSQQRTCLKTRQESVARAIKRSRALHALIGNSPPLCHFTHTYNYYYVSAKSYNVLK